MLVALPIADSSAQVRWKGKTVQVSLLGVTPPYLEAKGLSLAHGDFFVPQDEQGIRLVAVLGNKIAGQLFDGDSFPIGAGITVRGKRVRVIGVLSPSGTRLDHQILMPFATVQKRLLGMTTVSGQMLVDEIHILLADAHQVESSIHDVEVWLREQRNVSSLEDVLM